VTVTVSSVSLSAAAAGTAKDMAVMAAKLVEAMQAFNTAKERLPRAAVTKTASSLCRIDLLSPTMFYPPWIGSISAPIFSLG
jgi:hypothetical protein